MKISIQEDSGVLETEVLIKCKTANAEIDEILACLSLAGDTVTGKTDGQTHLVPLIDVLYFESVDNRIFFYTADAIYESSIRLYQLEEKLKNTAFARVSKSALVNLKKLKSIVPERNGRLMGMLKNGENVLVSRQYVREIKNKLGV